ncbi:MAG TPA: tail fiber protein [Pyrinomonadaceae bacterium]|nr:tail fiber protein [Pyrinomonadaceae bacterium]
MSRRKFFRTGLIGLSAAAFPWTWASARAGRGGDDLSDLKDRVANLEDSLKGMLVNSPPNVPIGTILAYAGPIDGSHPPPQGWLLCDGSAVRASDFEALWRKLRVPQGTGFRGAWGGDGNPNFNLPDLVGRFLRGVDKDLAGQPSNPARDPDRDDAKRPASRPGGNTGNNVGSMQGHEFLSHKHVLTDPKHSHDFSASRVDGAGAPGQRHPSGLEHAFGTDRSATGITMEPTGGSETRPVNAYVYWLIRAK